MGGSGGAAKKTGERIAVYITTGDFLGEVTTENFTEKCSLFRKRVQEERKCTRIGLAVHTEDGVLIVTCRRLVGRLPPGEYRGELVLRASLPAKSIPQEGEAWRCV